MTWVKNTLLLLIFSILSTQKKYNVIIADSVFLDLEDIPYPKVISKIVEKIYYLGSFPELGAAIEKKNWIDYRRLIVGSYRVIYSLNKSKKVVYDRASEF